RCGSSCDRSSSETSPINGSAAASSSAMAPSRTRSRGNWLRGCGKSIATGRAAGRLPSLATRLPAVAVDPLTEEQREIRELVRTLARDRVAPRAAEIDKSAEFPHDMVELLREHEIFGLPFEEQYGGTGTGALMVLVAVEELSKVCATTGLLLAVQELGSLGIKLAGTDEQ